ncbi:Hypothetical protein POVR1_LOCUS565 [uncultured virus]|nr:Hypothetical protein POVR1_LOCUS565 [uncultured virus]
MDLDDLEVQFQNLGLENPAIIQYIDSLISYPTSEEIERFLPTLRVYGAGYRLRTELVHEPHKIEYVEIGLSASQPVIFHSRTITGGYKNTQEFYGNFANYFNPLDDILKHRQKRLAIGSEFIFLDVISIMRFHYQKPTFINAINTYGRALCHQRLKLAMIEIVKGFAQSQENYKAVRYYYAAAYINCRVMEILYNLIDPEIYRINIRDLNKPIDEMINLKSAVLSVEIQSMISFLIAKIQSLQ